MFGGPSPEHDVSILTGLQAAHALEGSGRPTRAVYWDKVGNFHEVDAALEPESFTTDHGPPTRSTLRFVAGEGLVAPGKLGRAGRALEVGTVLVCCHGGPGENGTLQAVLDLAGIAYAGPSAAGAALGMDKLAFGSTAAAAGLPSLPRVVVADGEPEPAFAGPYIVKPRFGGSSIGIEVVGDWASAVALSRQSVHLRAGAIVEPWRGAAVDLQISLRSWPQLSLSPVEKPLRQAESKESILGYRDKYVGGQGMVSAPRELPAEVPDEVRSEIVSAATALAALTGLRGVARIDFLWDEPAGEVFVNEINTIPGSLSKYLWEAATPPVPFRQLLDDLLAEAAARPTTHWSAEGADGSALRSAGTIASKLG
jgi:D-alanine-D-alanine ligase